MHTPTEPIVVRRETPLASASSPADWGKPGHLTPDEEETLSKFRAKVQTQKPSADIEVQLDATNPPAGTLPVKRGDSHAEQPSNNLFMQS